MLLKKETRKLKKNKKNTKWLMVELMKISSIDFTVEHMQHKLHQYGFDSYDGRYVFNLMMELCEEFRLIFNGYRPVKIDDRYIGEDPVFGLIRSK